MSRLGSRLVVFACACIALAPTISDSFLFDDAALVDVTRFLTVDKIGAYFTSNTMGDNFGPYYRPIHFLSLLVNRLVFGHHAWGYHLVNVLLHGLTSVVFLEVLLALGVELALFAAIVFAVHPVHVDAVAFIQNRSEVLALLFVLLSGWTLVSSRSSVRVAIACAAFLLALLSKETAAGALAAAYAAVFVVSLARRRMPAREIWGTLIALSATMIAYLFIKRWAVGSVGALAEIGPFKDKGFTTIFPTMSRVFADYVVTLVLPVDLRINFMGYPLSHGLLEPRALLSYALHAGLLLFAFVSLRRRTTLAAGIVACYAALSPVSHLIPFHDMKAERFLYVVSALFCFLLARALAAVTDRRRRALIATLPLVFFASTTLSYARYFRGPDTLWPEMVARAPGNPIFQLQLGTARYLERDYAGAIAPLEAARAIQPALEGIYLPLALSYDAARRPGESNAIFTTALARFPGSFSLHYNYAVFLCRHQHFGPAAEVLTLALTLKPGDRAATALLAEARASLQAVGQ